MCTWSAHHRWYRHRPPAEPALRWLGAGPRDRRMVLQWSSIYDKGSAPTNEVALPKTQPPIIRCRRMATDQSSQYQSGQRHQLLKAIELTSGEARRRDADPNGYAISNAGDRDTRRVRPSPWLACDSGRSGTSFLTPSSTAPANRADAAHRLRGLRGKVVARARTSTSVASNRPSYRYVRVLRRRQLVFCPDQYQRRAATRPAVGANQSCRRPPDRDRASLAPPAPTPAESVGEGFLASWREAESQLRSAAI